MGEADIIFLNTCAIREKAESRIRGRLGEMKGLKEGKGVLSKIKKPDMRETKNIQEKEKGRKQQQTRGEAIGHRVDDGYGRDIHAYQDRDIDRDNEEIREKTEKVIGVLGCMAERLK